MIGNTNYVVKST